MDYEKTFAPVAKMTTICTLIAVALIRQWYISQLDVKNAFLNGDLQEKVYMTSPPGVSHDSGYVCKFKKALYGLKQAPRAWFEKFSIVISSLGFVSSSNDSALFIKCTDVGRIIISSSTMFWFRHYHEVCLLCQIMFILNTIVINSLNKISYFFLKFHSTLQSILFENM
jgi:hypothetical protein